MKTFVKHIMIGSLLITALACNKNDDTPTPEEVDPIQQPDPRPDPEPENRAPGTFTLLEVADGGTGVDLLPTFTWNISTDPDGDTVSYELYLGLDGGEENIVATNLTTTTFALSEKLNMAREYKWRVVATDGKGGETSSETFSFNSRSAIVTKIATTMPFSPRNNHASVVFQDKMWVIGGDASGYRNDVWSSSDGLHWDLVKHNDNFGFSSRGQHASTVFKDKIHLIGGYGDGLFRPEVFSSSDAVNWDQHLFPLGQDLSFSLVVGHTLEVFRDKLWLIGGYKSSTKHTNDIWSTQNGFSWTLSQKEPSAIFEPLSRHASVVFDDKIWVMGGETMSGFDTFYISDIWNSTDGENWSWVADVPFTMPLEALVYDDKLWVISKLHNEIWYSIDGKNWIDATPEDSYITKGFSTVVFNDKIWLLGGYGNDGYLVWTIE